MPNILTKLLILFFVISASQTQSAELPQVTVSNVRRVFYNGDHNAFTDLVRFNGKIYLAFRTCPEGHMVHPTSSIIVLQSSDDANTWKPVHQFSVPLRDTRDPHFLIFKEKLFLYTGTWYCGETSPESYHMNQQLGYGVWTEDGTDWHGPTMLEGTYGHYIWRAATYDGVAYLCGRRKREFTEKSRKDRTLIESAMLESDDGLRWRTRSLFQKEWGDETAFLFEDNGDLLAIARRGSSPAEICRSSPPYRDWQRTMLDRYIGGPLVAKWGDHTLVGGRKSIGGKGPKTSLYWLQDDQLHEFAELPSGGDNSYPGFLQLTENTAIVSWYSSHEKDAGGKTITAIYMADLSLKQAD